MVVMVEKTRVLHVSSCKRFILIILRSLCRIKCRFWGVSFNEKTPHFFDYVRQENIVGVSGDNPHDEDAVVAEVVLREHLEQRLVVLVVDDAQQLEVLLDVGGAVRLEDGAPDPGHQVAARDGRHQDQPKPDEKRAKSIFNLLLAS